MVGVGLAGERSPDPEQGWGLRGEGEDLPQEMQGVWGTVNLVSSLALNLMCILYWLKCRALESVERRRDKLLRWNTLHAPGKQYSFA